MEIQSSPNVSAPKPVRPQARVDEQRTAEQLAARRAQEKNTIDQRRMSEQVQLRRAQEQGASKGRQVDRYA